MGTNLPSTIPELLNWANTHEDLWTVNFAQIGLSSAQAVAFKNLLDGFIQANTAAEEARQASKDATLVLQGAVAAIRITGGAYVNLIKAYAETTGNMNVYSLAGVSPDSPPSQLPPPETPRTFGATVNGDGSLTIKWKITQPTGLTGVQYMVSRRLEGQNSFTMVGSAGRTKSFTDMTLPVGIDRVEYIVLPKRGEVSGEPSSIFTVQFGSVSGGGMSISTIESVPNTMKIAA